jgi:hypothetical protein
MDEPAESKTPPVVAEPGDPLVTRVAALWIWTVFFGLSGGLSYSFLSTGRELMMAAPMLVGGGRGWGGFPNATGTELVMLVVPAAYAIGLLASVGAWLFLYLYFAHFVLPVVFFAVKPLQDDRRRRLAGHYLNRTYQLLLIAALARATPDLVYLLLPALGRFGFR